MGSLRFSELADSPTMILSPHQRSFGSVASYHSSLQQYHSFKPVTPVEVSQNLETQPSPTLPLSGRSSLGIGSKRKRDDEPVDRESSPHSIMNASQTAKRTSVLPSGQPSPTHGHNCLADAMVISKETPEPGSVNSYDNAISSRHKFRRRETADTLSLTTINNSIVPTTSNPKSQEQAIDQFTHLLGVGWARVESSDPTFKQAVRGWEKYIENHYPLTEVAILATSKALEGAFLTLARDYENIYLRRFMLFKEDLAEARLIASDWGTCLARLQQTPIKFEYQEVLRAQRTPDLTPTSDDSGDIVGLPQGHDDPMDLPQLPLAEGMDETMICD